MDTRILSAEEQRLRDRLGIPAEARRVLLLQESSHWDTNWLRTSDEYFEHRIEPIFEAVLRELAAEPTRIFAIESLFFLKRYWEHHPEQRGALAQLLASRRLRLIGASLTTPDTLLPHPESVLRDYLIGQEWLREIGSDVFPKVAYFPDNFGHSPSLPSLMRAAGVEAVGVTRLDGMHFVGSDWRPRGSFPLRGSTAERLLREHRTLDFVWRDDAGAELLCHWNAFTYFQGDMLAHVGIIRWNGTLFGFPWRTASHVARQLEGFARRLGPVSPTPYLFCPIGCDFNPPIPGLAALVDRYNRERFERSGTFVVLAGLDDYFDLVASHRSALPVLEVDPNPAWMGFYASRPELKARHARTARRLLEAEADAARLGRRRQELDQAWELVALSNHHDFITGTSPDRVVHAEQLPWLAQAEALLDPPPPPPPAPCQGAAPKARLRAGELVLRVQGHTLTFSEDLGGCLVGLRDPRGMELLAGPSLDLVAYRDTGGLWRLGHEYLGGSFRELCRTSDRAARLKVHSEGGATRVDIEGWLGPDRFVRSVTCTDDSAGPLFGLSTLGLPAARTTVTCRIALREPLFALRMDAAGGPIRRPLVKLYTPTFWPALSRVEAGPCTLSFSAPTAVTGGASGTLEWIVARHATKEIAFGLLPVLAHPVGGTVSSPQAHEAALRLGPEPAAPHPWVRLSRPGVAVAALKPAANGHGVILRLVFEAPLRGATVEVGLAGDLLTAASLCDAREADLVDLEVTGGVAKVPCEGRIATVRVLAQGLARAAGTPL